MGLDKETWRRLHCRVTHLTVTIAYTLNRVLLGRHTLTGDLGAIKIFNKDSQSPTLIKNEVQLQRAAEDKNVVAIRDFYPKIEVMTPGGKKTPVVALVTEYIPGVNLLDLLKNFTPLPEVLARTLFIQLLKMVQALHKKNISHRDIKPENVLVSEDFTLKLTDFGLATHIKETESATTPVGTMCYCIPELLRGEKYNTKQADIFCCGVMLFTMISGHRPFGKADKRDELYSHLIKGDHKSFWEAHELLTSKDKPNFTFSKDFKDLLNHMLSHTPSERLAIRQLRLHPWIKGETLGRKKLQKVFDMMMNPEKADSLEEPSTDDSSN